MEKICEQGKVLEVTEISSQDWHLHRTVEQILVNRVEVDKIVPLELVSERMSKVEKEGVYYLLNESWPQPEGVVSSISGELGILFWCLPFICQLVGLALVTVVCSS